MVQAVSVEGKKTKMISALQLTRGLKKGEETYVAALVHDESGEGRKGGSSSRDPISPS